MLSLLFFSKNETECPMKKLIAGTRGSVLARIQTKTACTQLKENIPTIEIETKVIKTKGDKILDTPLAKIDGKGLFTKELENVLLSGKIHFAVHSLKDLPVELPKGLTIGAYLKRANHNDVLISKDGLGLGFDAIPENGTIATGSLRRALQIKKLRPDLKTHDIRGNITTRITKFYDSNWDGLIVAGAALARMDITDLSASEIEDDSMLSAVGQGIIAIECKDDPEILKHIRTVNHTDTELSAIAERAYLEGLGGGCQVPMACHASIEGSKIRLKGLYMPEDGKYFIKNTYLGYLDDARGLGLKLAEYMLSEYEKLRS